MRIELQPRGAVLNGTLVHLTPREQALLSWLLDHAGAPQSRETLLTEVWGYSRGTRSRTVDSTLNRLRGRLEAGAGAPVAIRAIRGRGWVYRPSDAPEAAPFVGRSEACAVVERWLAGRGVLLTVVGAPGIGKSALAARCVGSRAFRIDGLRIGSADDWFRAVEAAGRRIVWVDDADGAVDLLRTLLPDALDRRLLVTSRRPLRHPAEEILRLGPLPEAEVEALAEMAFSLVFPGSIRIPDALARQRAAHEGNPFAILREGARVDLGRSLDGLAAGARAGLERLARIPPRSPVDERLIVPHGLAVALVGAEDVLTDLHERSLLDPEPGGWRVPALVREGLGVQPTLEPAVSRWVVDRISSQRDGGDVRWLPYVHGLEVERALIGWVALTASDREVIGAAVLALDEHHRRVQEPDLRPFHDRAVQAGVPDARLRRVSWYTRIGDAGAAAADHASLGRTQGEEGTTRERMVGAMTRAFSAYRVGDMVLCERASGEALVLAEALGEHRTESTARFTLAQVALWRGDCSRALALARAARTVPVNLDRAGHTVTSFLGRFLHEAGLDEQAREALAESRRIAAAIAFDEGVWFTDAVLAWIDIVGTRDAEALERMEASCAHLEEIRSIYAAGTRLRYAWARIVAGAPERGLSDLRAITTALLERDHPVDAAAGRAFTVAGRVCLGLPPTAGWMVPDTLEGDPAVRDLVRGFEASAAGDREAVYAVLARTAEAGGSRVRALRHVLNDRSRP